MKRIVIDGDLCQGTGECAVIAPGAVTFDGTGIASVADGCGELDDAVADRLVATCPSMAISAQPN